MFKWFKDKFDKKDENDIEVKEEGLETEESSSNLDNDLEEIKDDLEETKENLEEKLEDTKDNLEKNLEEAKENLEEKAKEVKKNVEEDLKEGSEDTSNSLTLNEKDSSLVDEELEEENKEENKKQGFFQKMFSGLTKTRDNFTDKINQVLGNYLTIDDDLYEDLEDILITADVGVDTTLKLIDNLRETIKKEKITDPSLVLGLLGEEAKKLIDLNENNKSFNPNISPTIILVVGVNGVGKTTTVGKLAAKYKAEGKKVLLVAADTFRAAATEQLQEWARRTGVDIVHHAEGSDPAAVVYDAIQAAKARNSDIILCDTAGRLHNKANLMNELEKIYRIIDKNFPEANKESLIVLDATTGQNALLQAKQFKEVAKVSGIVITKLDGTAKGGIILPLINELKVPVTYIGVGEQVDDLQDFDSDKFIDSIFVK
nr:signal recognition particle-docking protein FtsY [Neofamilia massiliensis]